MKHGRHWSPFLRRLGFEPLEDRRLLSISSPALELFNTSPALFVENQGQWADESVRFLHQGDGVNVAMTDAGPAFQVFQSSRLAPRDEAPSRGARWLQWPPAELTEPEETLVEMTEFSVHFDGANTVEPAGLDRSETRFNYFVGPQEDWHAEVPSYEVVAYEGLYDGIDLLTWGQRDSLKYEFHLTPGADYRQIKVSYEGIEGLSIDDDGSLRVDLGNGWDELVDDAPYIYQQIDGQQVEVAGRFIVLDADTYSFELSGDYDPTRPLVIDPDLAWSTYLGGSNNDAGEGIATDGDGNVLVTGYTASSGWVSGGFDTSYNGRNDAFVAKLSSSGEHLWSTYLGGLFDDQAWGVAVDAGGNVLVTGTTYSSGWVSGGFDTSYGGADAFVAKLSPSGAHLWSTYLGGSLTDHGNGIATDGGGNVLVTGTTASSDWVSGGFDTSYDGRNDAFVAKLTASGGHAWSTYLGGSDADYAGGIATDGGGNVLVTGMTKSSGWVSGGFQTSYNGSSDAFVAKLTSSGGHLWSTYLGGGSSDVGSGIATDGGGNVLVGGGTYSSGWVSGGFDTSYNGSSDPFVAKLSASGGHLWSTYLGGGQYDNGVNDIAVDGGGNVLVTGGTGSINWVSGGFNTSYGGGGDAFVAKLTSSGRHVWSSYLGGSNGDSGYGIAVDGGGNVLVTGGTSSSGWVAGGFDTSYNGSYGAFVAKISASGGAMYWDGQGDGLWSDPSRWLDGQPGALPDDSTYVVIETNRVSVDENAEAYALTITTTGTLAVNPQTRLSLGGGLQINGSGTLAAMLDGTGSGSITAAGTATLGGTLVLEAVAPVGDLDAGEWGDKTRTIIQADGGRGGTWFDAGPAAGEHLGHGAFYQGASYGVTTVDVNLFQAGPGDADGDGLFNFADLVAIFAESGAYYGNSDVTDREWTGGDFTGDGAFTFADLVFAFSKLGAHYGGAQYAADADAAEPAVEQESLQRGAGLHELTWMADHQQTSARSRRARKHDFSPEAVDLVLTVD